MSGIGKSSHALEEVVKYEEITGITVDKKNKRDKEIVEQLSVEFMCNGMRPFKSHGAYLCKTGSNIGIYFHHTDSRNAAVKIRLNGEIIGIMHMPGFSIDEFSERDHGNEGIHILEEQNLEIEEKLSIHQKALIECGLVELRFNLHLRPMDSHWDDISETGDYLSAALSSKDPNYVLEDRCYVLDLHLTCLHCTMGSEYTFYQRTALDVFVCNDNNYYFCVYDGEVVSLDILSMEPLHFRVYVKDHEEHMQIMKGLKGLKEKLDYIIDNSETKMLSGPMFRKKRNEIMVGNKMVRIINTDFNPVCNGPNLFKD